MKPRVLFLVGPTAIGKTDIALQLAAKINAEIISCDSMQIYKGMEILTSKPALEVRKKIPHHLIDIVSCDKEYNVSKYRLAAIRKINQIIKRGRVPLFVGGSGLYMSVVADGIFKAKTESSAIRRRLYQEAQDFGAHKLYDKLMKVDPKAAEKIHPNDKKRVIRALEVFELTGKPISQLQSMRIGLGDKYDIKILGLDMPRDKLYKRIDERVDKMFKRGLVKEVKKLLKLKLSKTARAAIGLKEIKGFLEGLYDFQEAKRLMKRNTRQYAKRQMSWFRKDRRINWINIEAKEKPAAITKRIVKQLMQPIKNS
jgi:tRNA dimethylallyltransferase